MDGELASGLQIFFGGEIKIEVSQGAEFVSVYQNHLEDVLKHSFCEASPAESLIQRIWGGAWEFAFLTGSQWLLILLVQG